MAAESVAPYNIDYYCLENKTPPPCLLAKHESEDWEGPPTDTESPWRNPSPPPSKKRRHRPATHNSGESVADGAPAPSKKSKPTQVKPSELKCPFHKKRIEIKQSQKGNTYATCMFFGNSCPFICFGNLSQTRRYRNVKLSEDVAQGPWNCYCDQPTKMRQCQNVDSDNFGRFFLGCSQPQSKGCNFFQWCNEAWGENIRLFRADNQSEEEPEEQQ